MKTSTELSHTETAKLIRQTLKAKFTGTKFSVRSSAFSGGTSVDISWTDGPTEKAVERAIRKISQISLAMFITCNRAYSVEFVAKCAAKEAKSQKRETPEVSNVSHLSAPWINTNDDSFAHWIWQRAKVTNA